MLRLDGVEGLGVAEASRYLFFWSEVKSLGVVVKRQGQEIATQLPQNQAVPLLEPDWTPPGRLRWQAIVERLETGKTEEAVSLTVELAWELFESHPQVASFVLWAAARRTQASEYGASVNAALLDSAGPDLRSFYEFRILLARVDLAMENGEIGTAVDLCHQAIEVGRRLAEPTALILAMDTLRQLELRRGQPKAARRLAAEVLHQAQESVPGSAAEASAHNGVGLVAADLGELDRAASAYEEALRLYQLLAPGSQSVAMSLNNLGTVARQKGDLAAARRFFERALAIHEQLDPESQSVASALNNLGIVTWDEGDLEAARSYLTRALALRQRQAPESIQVARTLNNLGNVAKDEWDLTAARRYYLASLRMRQKLTPGSLGVAAPLNNLGVVAQRLGDLDRASEYYERALALLTERAPSSVERGWTLGNLGGVAWERGDLDDARRLLGQALEMASSLSPESLDVALQEENLGRIEAESGNAPAARALFSQALEIVRRLAPESLTEARLLHLLGLLALSSGEVDRAAALQEQALELAQRLAPKTLEVVEPLDALGRIAHERGDLQQARAFFERAVAAIEFAPDRIGGAGARIFWNSRSGPYYHALVKVYLELEDFPTALAALDRSRARTLVEQLSTETATTHAIEPSLQQRRAAADAERRRLTELLAAANGATARESVEEWQTSLLHLRTELEALETEEETGPGIKMQSPERPAPESVASALPPGALLLAFSMDDQEAILIARLEHDAEPEWRSVVLDLGPEALREKVWLLRANLARSPSAAVGGGAWKELAASLGSTLLTPVADLIDRADRLVIVPDGPLHRLPFGALRVGKDDDDTRFLVELLPIVVAPSLSLFQHLRQHRPAETTGRLDGDSLWVGFGDPVPIAGGHEGSLGAGEAVGRFGPLPGSRREVRAVKRLIGRRGRALLGPAASEQEALAIGPNAAVIHFASHARLDDRFPMSSALLLSPSIGRDGGDGYLQAWEIAQELHLDADLVVLSACETGSGQLMGGEGVVGLTRAFLHAGAASVVVSHWGLADRSTAVLMENFYRGLRRGLDKDEALRQAQLEFLADDRRAHPYYWAAFQLVGSETPIKALAPMPAERAEKIGVGLVTGIGVLGLLLWLVRWLDVGRRRGTGW